MLKRYGLISRNKPISRMGKKHDEWKKFRDTKAESDRDEEGLLYCQDYLIGLPKCHIGTPELDLHHIVGRESRPDLYFDASNLIWLTRECHQKEHARVQYETSN